MKKGKISNKLEDPDYVEYWRQQFKLDDLKEKYCLNCENYYWCWHYGEGYCYHEDIIEKNCKIKEMRRVIAKLGVLNKKHGGFYYGATIEEYEELRKILNVKEKTPKYTDTFLLGTGIAAVAGRIINPKDLSVWQKIKAIAGLEETVGFCNKHKLYYHQEPFTAQMNQDIVYACPSCIKELKNRRQSGEESAKKLRG